ncbi:L-threonylcarbamoyladenylate synthase [Natronogracilivirga saccharolytica]|uniref:Threonylcarbamoyl-AMP synthase n=1 Tax=Natronogracilivirga saccharolytica TaxID=2812953 RepID=A0A8J7UX44_9BACT|nr:L-threonylcarbamoyladenylate synthase [Natronogracilivirga saccharolytica]MBP3192909.1 threonylcarbamoyl-AMP synthase [Natronogracilivirga saccharolytica]
MVETHPEISLSRYAGQIRSGNVVAFPTETVYGLGADAWNADAVAQIFALKGRPPDNPLIVHVSSLEMAATLVTEISEDARRLMDRFWPGPLALILPKRPEVLDIVTAGLPTVAIRMPDHPIPLRLISEAGPIAAPSANTSGRPSPTRGEHVRQDFGKDVPVIDGGSCQFGLESTVLDLSERPYTVLRPGHITQSELEQVLLQPVRMGGFTEQSGPESGIRGRVGSVRERDRSSSGDDNKAFGGHASAPRSPGMKYTHYAPDALVRWMHPEELPEPAFPAENTLYLLHQIRPEENKGENTSSVSADRDIPVSGDSGSADFGSMQNGATPGVIIRYDGDYQEMARDLYDRFRMADLQGFEEVAIEPFSSYPEEAEALLNRIRKAIGE